MATIYDIFDKALFDEMIHNRYLDVNKHPDYDLFIYNYSKKAQFDRVWNEVTLNCRGLIADKDGNIVARPFRKFFNMEELPVELLNKYINKPFEAYCKMDGSLGILVDYNNEKIIATRGSFTSDQAIEATKLLHTKYVSDLDKFNPDYTYLFEIIYPSNRIVVNYGDTKELILLAVINKATGKEIRLSDINDLSFTKTKKYEGVKDFASMKALNLPNEEGFVVVFEDNFRMKLKFDEYCRLHKVLTHITERSIWEVVSNKGNLDEIIENVPDEFYNWVKDTVKYLNDSFAAIEMEATELFNELINSFSTYPSKADFAKKMALDRRYYPVQSILFKLYDKRDYSDIIWKKLKPAATKPFETLDDN